MYTYIYIHISIFIYSIHTYIYTYHIYISYIHIWRVCLLAGVCAHVSFQLLQICCFTGCFFTQQSSSKVACAILTSEVRPYVLKLVEHTFPKFNIAPEKLPSQ